ncbi:MAG: class I SAM-dependent methyltransferase, partial [Candidatus Thorarchaeota archaeon]
MMSSKKLFLKVVLNDGERTRKTLLEHNLLDIEYKILSQDGALFIPLRQEVQSELIDTIMGPINFEKGEMEFEPVSHGP